MDVADGGKNVSSERVVGEDDGLQAGQEPHVRGNVAPKSTVGDIQSSAHAVSTIAQHFAVRVVDEM